MKKIIHFEISDVILFFRDNFTPSGIQRVQLEIIRYFLGKDGGEANFVIASGAHDVFSVVDRSLAKQMVEMVD